MSTIASWFVSNKKKGINNYSSDVKEKWLPWRIISQDLVTITDIVFCEKKKENKEKANKCTFFKLFLAIIKK